MIDLPLSTLMWAGLGALALLALAFCLYLAKAGDRRARPSDDERKAESEHD